MTFITARDLRLKPTQIWEKLKANDAVVVTLNGAPVAVISGVTAENLEETLKLMKRLKAQMAVSKLRQDSLKSGRSQLSSAEVNAEIKAARKGRSE